VFALSKTRLYIISLFLKFSRMTIFLSIRNEMSIDQLISFRKQKKMKRRKTNETMYVRASP
jgi:hypothetical protein